MRQVHQGESVMRKNQMYRAWAGDKKRVWSQIHETIKVTCQGCGKEINTTMELVVNGKCEECAKAQASK
jgi:hypothetical protein